MLMLDELAEGFVVQVKIKRYYNKFKSNGYNGDDDEDGDTESTNGVAMRRCGYIGKVTDFDFYENGDEEGSAIEITFTNRPGGVNDRVLWFNINEIRCIVEPKVKPIKHCWISWWSSSRGYVPLKVSVTKAGANKCTVKIPEKLSFDLKEITITKWYTNEEECQKACDEQAKEEAKAPTL